MGKSQHPPFSVGIGIAASVIATGLLSGFLLQAQAPGTKPGTTTKKGAGAPKGAPAPAAAPQAARRAPLTKTDIEKLWAQQNAELMSNEIRLRGLAFEPEEDWLAALTKGNPGPMAAAVSDLQKLIPPAPEPDAVAAQAPEILTRLKAAAQARNEDALKQVIHPELLASKVRVYDLFDTSNYRDHALGRFSPTTFRRVGVQFFQLTTSQVERLHYVLFSTSHGKIVVRDIITGPQVAELFLKDEKELALSKLDLVFRAMNDGDQSGLKNLCTPGLYESIQELAGGARLTRGKRLTRQNALTASAPLDQKSIRPVVRVGVPTNSGKRIDFDVDFERVNNDLKVVRLRDTQNRVIAWDPDIDNYLNRRFNLPDGPKIVDPPQGKTDFLQFQPLSYIKQMAANAMYDGNVQKLNELAEEVLESEPDRGDGYGLRAGAKQMQGKYEEAESDALLALTRGGTVYLPVLRHKAFNSKEFWPVALGISASGIQYLPSQGGGSASTEQIDVGSIEKSAIETGNRFKKPRPFLNLEFRRDGKKETYNFAATGTTCPGGGLQRPNRADLINFEGQSVCASTNPNQKAGPIPGLNLGSATGPMLVPREWQRSLMVVVRSIEEARKRAGSAKK